jgi:hypothetical protein
MNRHVRGRSPRDSVPSRAGCAWARSSDGSHLHPSSPNLCRSATACERKIQQIRLGETHHSEYRGGWSGDEPPSERSTPRPSPARADFHTPTTFKQTFRGTLQSMRPAACGDGGYPGTVRTRSCLRDGDRRTPGGVLLPPPLLMRPGAGGLRAWIRRTAANPAPCSISTPDFAANQDRCAGGGALLHYAAPPPVLMDVRVGPAPWVPDSPSGRP